MTKDTQTPGAAPAQDLAEMAELIRQERKRLLAAQIGPVRLLNLVWGLVYLLGGLVVWAAHPEGAARHGLPALPQSSWIVAAGLLVLGVVGSVTLSVRMGTGRRGPSASAGAMYGWSWSIAMLGTWLYGQALARGSGLGAGLLGELYPTSFLFTAAVVYLVGAAVWRSGWQFAQGATLIAVTILGAAAGVPDVYLVLGALGGGCLLVFTLLLGPLSRWESRARREG
ncbi:MAG: hypothetical protein Q4E05_09390 [Pseudoclavibacter sp.]|nr:hypothetical protein [Pseudoclavibacter sp.]